jgi:hypothetical protein
LYKISVMHIRTIHKTLFILSLFATQKAQSQTCGLTVSNMRPPQYFSENRAKNVMNDVDLYKFKSTHRDSFTLNQFTKFKVGPSVLNAFGMSLNSISTPISFVFSVNNLPFFCKLEYKMGVEKQYPLKIRLGDVQYVDQLEGKNKNGNLH